MSKYKGFEDFKIIKKCDKNVEVKRKEEEIKSCGNLEIPEGKFIEIVSDEILYVDDKIKIKAENEALESTERVKIIKSDPSLDLNIPPTCCDLPSPLKDQINLPISSIEQLDFYETFIISKSCSGHPSCIPIIPDIMDIDEIGSSSIVVEEMDNGNILIFMSQQMFENGERRVFEALSVVKKDLSFVHEKRIERKCKENNVHVSI